MSENADDIRILVVEDDESLLQMVSALLEGEGYTVEGATDGETAIKMAQVDTFDLVITDVKLGKLDGLDTLEELKKGESTFQSLVMTGYSTEADTIRAMKLGVGNYLKKPFSLDDFLVAVQEQVRRAVVERKVQARESAALKTLCWALESVLKLQVGEEDADILGSEKAAVLAERTALALSFPSRTVLAVKALTLLSCLKQAGLAPWDEVALNGFPAPVPSMLASLNSSKLSECPPEVQIVQMAVAASTSDPETASLSAELREQFPELTEDLGQALDMAYRDEVAPSLAGSERHRSLLSLASALQARGDLDGAASALSRLGNKHLSSESLKARLLEARLEWENKRDSAAFEKIHSVVEQAASLGPRAVGQTSLEGGLLLTEMKHPEALDFLNRAKESLDKDGTSEELARARLGLVAAGQGDKETVAVSLAELMQARHLESFLRSGPWLLPLLFELETQDSAPEISRASRRLVRDLPQLVAAQIRRGLSKPALMSALKGIAAVGREGHEKSLRWVLENSQEQDIKRAVERLLGEQAKAAVPPVLRIYLSGSFETWFGNTLLTWSGTKYQYLLAYISSGNTTIVPLETLLETFWPDHGKRAQRCFSQALSSIKKILQPADWEQKLAYVDRTSDGVGLNPKLPVWCDVDEIRKALQEARDLEREDKLKESMAAIRRANQTYRGPFLAGCYMDWALARREKLVRVLNESTLKLAGRSLESGLFYEALAESEEVLARDPICEQAQQIKMNAMSKTGRSAEAIRSYEVFARNLKHEVGVEPNTELIRAYHVAKMTD